MRKDLKRKIAMTATSCLAFACVSVGGVALASASGTEDPVFSMENNGAFYIVEGASVKLYEGESLASVDGNAMRFIFEMSETQYESMIENGEYKDGVSVKAYVIAEDMIDEGLTTAQQIMSDSNAVATDIPADKWFQGTSQVKDSSATVYHTSAYVYDLPKEYYDDNVCAFAVLTTGTGAMYTTVQSRSMSYVADVALESGKFEADRTTLEGYLTDKYVWVKDVSSNTVVTDYTTGNYTRIQNANTGITYFQHINGSGYPQANPAIVTTEIGGVTGTYARIGVGEGQGSSYPTVPYYLPNTMSVEKLQEFADRGYTLKLNLYVDAPEVNKNATVYTVTSNDGVLASSVANMRAETIVMNAWQEVEIDINDYIALVTANGEDYKEQLSGQRAEATLCINLGDGEYDVYFDSIKVALPVAENITVLSPEEPSGWYNDTTNGFAWVHASNQGLGKQVIKTETVGGVSGTYSYLTQNKGNWNMAFLAVPTLPVSALERYCEQGYTLKLKLYADKAVTVRTVNYNKDENGNLTTRESITTTTDGAYTGEEISVPKNTWVDIAIDLKSYIQDCAITPTQPSSLTNAGKIGTIAVKGSWTFHVYLGDMYLEAPNGEDVKTVNEGATVTVETPTATEGETYEYYQVTDGNYKQLRNNTVVAGAKDFEIAVVKVTKDENGKEIRKLYKAYKVKVTPIE